jgi:hypothetical protein
LLKGFEATLDSPEFRISIEKFDDIAFEANGLPIHLSRPNIIKPKLES